MTISDSMPMMRVNEILYTVGQADYISTLDATSGFYQIKLDEGSREYTAFVSQSNLYQFKRMPFGLKNASASYQRIITEVLQPCKDYALSYIDDVGVHTKGIWSKHIEHLDAVLSEIQKCGLTLRYNKCSFGRQTINFLGHIVGKGTHRPNPQNLVAIQSLRFPATKKQMKSLIGLINYYRSYVDHLSERIKPLTEMVKPKMPVMLVPTEKEIKVFEEVKLMLMSAPILRCPDMSKIFIIECDASKVGVGSTLSQIFEGEQHPICYASCSFSVAQQKWSVPEWEAFAILFSVYRYDPWIYGRKVVIYSDHSPLTYIRQNAPNNPRLGRWMLALQRYDIIGIHHKRGVDNVCCDSLSRLMTDEYHDEKPEEINDCEKCFN